MNLKEDHVMEPSEVVYKEMYSSLFKDVCLALNILQGGAYSTDHISSVIKILQAAQRKTEELYMAK